MVKKIAVALLCTVLGSSLYAGNNDVSSSKGFLGLEVGAATVQADRFEDFAYEGDAVEFGLRLGAEQNDWRAMFVFDYYNSDSDDQNIEKGIFMVDYILLESNSQMPIKPFVGVNVGYANYESTFIDDSGFTYGGQAGVIVGIHESVDLDLSYRYSLAEADALDHMGSIVFGLNYLY